MTDKREPKTPVSSEVPHPIGLGLGATSGVIAGASLGAAAGPVGVVAGAVVGAVVGGVVGKSAARSVDAAIENKYWQENFRNSSYIDPKLKYADYEPAYRFGWESYERHEGRRFEDLNAQLQREWDAHRADSPLTWEQAKAATRDAWHRVDRPSTSTSNADEFTAAEGAPERKAFETNSTMDRGDR